MNTHRLLLILALLALPASAHAGDPGAAPEEATCDEGTARVPAATFWLGNLHPDCDCPGGFHPKPAEQASTPDLCMHTHEVTVAAYQACAEAGACPPLTHTASYEGATLEADAACATEPGDAVNCVDAAQAHAYCTHAGGRVPSEAEWERAATGDHGMQQTGTSLWEWTTTPYMDDDPAAYVPELQGLPDDVLVTRGGFSDLAFGVTTPREINRAPLAPRTRHPRLGIRCVEPTR